MRALALLLAACASPPKPVPVPAPVPAPAPAPPPALSPRLPDGWLRYESPTHDFRISLPTQPDVFIETTGRQYVVDQQVRYYSIAVTRLAGSAYDRAPDQLLSRLHSRNGRISEDTLLVAGRPARRVRADYTREGRTEIIVLVPAADRVYTLGVSMDAPFDEAAATSFFSSFELLLP